MIRAPPGSSAILVAASPLRKNSLPGYWPPASPSLGKKSRRFDEFALSG
jgi:hypothetical protein